MKTSQQILNNPEEFWQYLTDEQELKIELELEVSGSPDFRIEINGETVYDQIAEPLVTINYPYGSNLDIDLNMWMYGKTDQDTIVEDGKIVKDKFVVIKRFVVNGFSLEKDYNFYYGNLKYYDKDNQLVNVEQGFWFNEHRLNLTFTKPFICWYLDHASENNTSELISYRNSISSNEVYESLFNNLKLLK